MYRFIFSFLLFFYLLDGFSQSISQDSLAVQTRKEKKRAKKELPPKKGDVYFSPVPIIGVNPAFGFVYGVGAATSWFMGEPNTTKLSSALFGLAFTTKQQTIVTLKSTM